jgi:hypothetical protein
MTAFEQTAYEIESLKLSKENISFLKANNGLLVAIDEKLPATLIGK